MHPQRLRLIIDEIGYLQSATLVAIAFLCLGPSRGLCGHDERRAKIRSAKSIQVGRDFRPH